MSLIIPKRYRARLLPETTEVAIKTIKTAFQRELASALNLRRVTAPLFVLSGTGLNDDLSGTEHAVTFNIADMGDRRAEVVHSLAKWKRVKLGAYGIEPHFGLYTDMNAIRTAETLDNLHSLYVDQWDWEQTITETDRNLDYLKSCVEKIYEAVTAPPTLPRPHTERTRGGNHPRGRSRVHHRNRRRTLRRPSARLARPRLRRLVNSKRRRLFRIERRHHALESRARMCVRTLVDGNTRRSRRHAAAIAPAEPRRPRTLQIPLHAPPRRTALVDWRRHRTKPAVHVPSQKSPHRRSASLNLARRPNRRMCQSRHCAHLTTT